MNPDTCLDLKKFTFSWIMLNWKPNTNDASDKLTWHQPSWKILTRRWLDTNYPEWYSRDANWKSTILNDTHETLTGHQPCWMILTRHWLDPKYHEWYSLTGHQPTDISVSDDYLVMMLRVFKYRWSYLIQVCNCLRDHLYPLTVWTRDVFSRRSK